MSPARPVTPSDTIPHGATRRVRQWVRRSVGLAFPVCLLAVALPQVSPVGAQPSPSGPAHAALDGHFGLVSEQFDIDPAGVFNTVVSLPEGFDATRLLGATIVVTAYNRLATRTSIAAAIDGDLPRSVDSVDVSSFSIVPGSAPTQLQVVVPVESTTRTAGALQFPRPGLYPVVIELSSGGDVLLDLLTFVHRLPGPDDEPETELPVAVAMSTTSPVVLDDLTDVVLDSATTAELTQLADLLEAAAVPVAVRIPPAVLSALDAAGPEGAALAARIGAALDGNDLLSSPSLPLDPSTAAAANQQALYTQWLRDGEDQLARVVAEPSVRTVVFADRPLSQAGGSLERDLGGRLLVFTAEQYDSLPGTFGAFTDTTQVVNVQVAEGVTVHATIVDRIVSDSLARAAANPALAAIYTVTDLLAARQQIVDQGSNPARHGITIATPDLALPDTDTFAALTTLLSTTDGLSPVTLDTLGVRTSELLDDGEPAVVQLPEVVDGNIADRVNLMASLDQEATNTASMLPPGDARAAEWTRLCGMLPTNALSDDQVTTLADELRTEYAAIRDSVVAPTGFKQYTLTGRRTTVPIKILNNSTIPLKVQVRVSSSKITRQDPQVVVLEPGTYTPVDLRIEARSNGSFPVTVDIFTPDGGIRLGPPIPITVKVTALSGLGNLVTGALLLVLLTWWVRHVRQNRRNQATASAAQRHPLSATPGHRPAPDATGPASAAGPARSPDAETSTLPPS